MASSKSAVQGFLGSLALLVVAVVVGFLVLTPDRDSPTPDETTKPIASAEDAKLKRQALRGSETRPGGGGFREVAPTRPERPEAAAPGGSGSVEEQSETAAAWAAAEAEDPDIQKAINHIDTGDVAAAMNLLEAVLKRDPKNEQALVEMAMIQLLDMKQTEQAMGYLQRVLEVNSKNQIVLSELVSLYEEQGRVDEGLGFMMEIQSRTPAPELAHGIGQLLTLNGRDAEAIEYYEKATASPDNQVRAYRDLAEAYSRSGAPDKAIDSYNRAITAQEKEIAEKSARGLPVQFAEERLSYTKMDKARELIRAGDLDQAQQLLDEVSAALPGDESVTALQESLNRKRAG